MQRERGAPSGRIGHWVLRHPLFAVALVVTIGFVAKQLEPLLFGAVLLIVLVASYRMRLLRWGLISLLLTTLALAIGEWRQARDDADRTALSTSAGGWAEGVAQADAVGSVDFWQAPVRLHGRGPKVWWQGCGEMPVEGSRVRGTGSYGLAQEPRNLGEFNRREWMKQQGLVAIFRQDFHGQAEVETGAISRAMSGARAGMRQAITRGLDENSTAAKVIRAVVLGEKPRQDEGLLEDFRHSGSMHVFSVSGLHVGMVAVLVWTIAACSGVSRRWLALPVIVLIFGYAWLTGANAPAVRAAWMAAVFLGAFCFRRRPDLANALGAVLLVLLLWDVRYLLQPSVQLSYGVVTTIAFGLPWTTRWFSRLAAAPMLVPVAEVKGLGLWWWRLRQWMASTFAVSCAASIGAAPLTLWHFGLVTPISVIAALLMLPLVFGVMALAMVSVLLSPIGELNGGINRLNGWLAGGCAKVAEVMAEVPGGHLHAGHEAGPVLWVCDLSHGDAAALWVPEKHAAGILIDCGGRNSFAYPLQASLNRLGLAPDSVILTHPDGGHVGGGHPVWRKFPIRQVILPVERARSPSYRNWLEQAPKDGVRLLQARQLSGLPLSERTRIEWLHLPDSQSQDLAADHRVLVMRLHWRELKILWLSDAGSAIEQAMLDSGRNLQADVIVAGCHDSDLSLGDDFVAAVQPRVIVMDDTDHPESLGPGSRQIQHWRDAGIMVIRQSEEGAVSLRPENNAWVIRGFLSGNVRRIK